MIDKQHDYGKKVFTPKNCASPRWGLSVVSSDPTIELPNGPIDYDYSTASAHKKRAIWPLSGTI